MPNSLRIDYVQYQARCFEPGRINATTRRALYNARQYKPTTEITRNALAPGDPSRPSVYLARLL